MLDAHATFEDFIEANDEERAAFRLAHPELYASFASLLEENLTLLSDPGRNTCHYWR